MSPKRRDIYLVICVCVAAAPFLPALWGQATGWDDVTLVTGNPLVRGGVTDGLVPLLSRPYCKMYMPVTYGSYWVGYHLWGKSPFGYHLMNLLCHVVSVTLAYRIFRALLRERWVACVAAGWWGIHPLHVEPVAWISGLKDALCMMLVLLCWRLYIQGRDSGSQGEGARRQRLAVLLSLGAFVLACLAKPAAAAFPLVLLGYDVFFQGKRGRGLVRLAPFFVLGAATAVLARVVQRAEEIGVTAPEGLLSRAGLAADSALFYLEKIFWPSGLSPVYGRMVADVLASPLLYTKLLIACGLIGLAVVLGKRWRLALVVFLAGLLPVSGIIPFGYQTYSTVADRYAYLLSLGIALVVGDLLVRCRRMFPGTGGRRSILIAACMGIWVGALGFVTWRQTAVWHESLTIWERVMACAAGPPAPALTNYGRALLREGRVGEALDVLARCAREYPEYARGRKNLVRALQRARQDEATMQEYSRALELLPAPLLLNYGNALFRAGQNEQAIEVLRRYVEAHPGHARGRYNLGRVLQATDKDDDARQEYQRVLELDPSHVNTWIALSSLAAKQGDFAAAARASERACQLDASNATAAFNLGLALLELNRPAEAAAALRRAVALRPDDESAQSYLRAALRRAASD